MALNITATPAAKVAERAALPVPEITFDVDAENSKVTVHAVFDLNIDESQAYMSKRTKVLGETDKPVPVSFDVDGEQQILSLGGNAIVLGMRLGARVEDKKADETAQTKADEEGASPATE